jgi:hypothetical protein
LGFARYLQYCTGHCRGRKSTSSDTDTCAESDINPLSQPDGHGYIYTVTESDGYRYIYAIAQSDGYKYA